jgi:hypothetical protein
MAVIDGELIRLERSVVLKVHPQALQVVFPKVAEIAQTSAVTK